MPSEHTYFTIWKTKVPKSKDQGKKERNEKKNETTTENND